MNKQEAIKKTEETVLRNISVTYQGGKETWYIDGVETPKNKVVDSINPNKAIPSEPDTSELVFEPKDDEDFEFIASNGEVCTDRWSYHLVDFEILQVGNVFRVGTAKNSAKYYFMNSEYDYWLPWSGQPKPKVLPKGLEFWSSSLNSWQISYLQDITDLHGLSYRWKRSEQV